MGSRETIGDLIYREQMRLRPLRGCLDRPLAAALTLATVIAVLTGYEIVNWGSSSYQMSRELLAVILLALISFPIFCVLNPLHADFRDGILRDLLVTGLPVGRYVSPLIRAGLHGALIVFMAIWIRELAIESMEWNFDANLGGAGGGTLGLFLYEISIRVLSAALLFWMPSALFVAGFGVWFISKWPAAVYVDFSLVLVVVSLAEIIPHFLLYLDTAGRFSSSQLMAGYWVAAPMKVLLGLLLLRSGLRRLPLLMER